MFNYLDKNFSDRTELELLVLRNIDVSIDGQMTKLQEQEEKKTMFAY